MTKIKVKGKNGKEAYKVSNWDIIKEWKNHNYQFYADDFLNHTHDDKSNEERLKLAESFMRGFVAEEFMFNYLNLIEGKNIYWTNPESRYSYSTEAEENHSYTDPDYVGYDELGEYFIDCKSGTYSEWNKTKSHGADVVVYLQYAPTGFIYKTYIYKNYEWIKTSTKDVTGYFLRFICQNF